MERNLTFAGSARTSDGKQSQLASPEGAPLNPGISPGVLSRSHQICLHNKMAPGQGTRTLPPPLNC